MNVTARDTLKVYWQQVRKHKLVVFLLFFTLGAATVLDVIIPLYYKEFFNVLTGAQSADPGTVGTLVGILFKILFIYCIAWMLFRIAIFTNVYFQPRVMSDLLQNAYDYLQRHSYGFFANRFVGALVRKVTKLSRAFDLFADRIYWDFYPLTIRIIGSVIVLYIFNHLIAYILLAWTFAFILLNYLFSLWKLKYDIKRSEKDTERTATLADALTNQNNIQLFTGFKFEFKRVRKVAEELRKLEALTWNLGAIADAIQALFFIAAEFGLMYVAIQYWKRGLLTLGDFVLIQSYLFALIGRIWQVGRHIRDTYESFADAKEMTEILHTPHEIQDARNAKELEITKGRIEFKKVSFNFHRTRRVLNNINLIIKPGEKVALIGPSGAGKSTIVKLILRMYDIEQGKILIDGQKINRVTQESLHQQISLVPQEPILFHRTLMDNIRYGRREASDEQVLEAAQLAHCDEFIQELPDGYNTYVGERGIKLSGGERQRVAIARAILKNAPILILDEATSSLDSHSEGLIQQALNNLMKGKTVIVIAHRLSTIRKMDRIIVIDKGKIVDEGTHNTLLKKDSLYKKLWKLQAGGFIPDPE